MLALRLGALTARSTLATRCLSVSSLKASKQASNQETKVERWKRLNNIYYGPEREHENFPMLAQADRGGKVRMGFIPDEWFQAFYDKTGVTGPYLLGTGFLTWLLSKEIWVVNHSFIEVLTFWMTVIFVNKKWGRQIGAYIEKEQDGYIEKRVEGPLNKLKKKMEDGIEKIEHTMWQQEGQKYLTEAKKENVMFQLEAIYRDRIQNVYQKVKNRLDYQLDIQSAKTRFEQEHMVDWIVNNVVKGITPQQEKDSISKCIADLKKLSAVS